MINDSENEFGDGDLTVPTDRPRRDGIAASSYRPFTAWPTAREEKSVWTRAREQLARLFRKRVGDANGLGPEPGISAPVRPPDDFEFPWSREEATAATAPPNAVGANEASGADDPFLAPFDTVEEALPTSSAGLDEPRAPIFPELDRGAENDTGSLREPSTLPEVTEEVVLEEEKGPGLFARLSGFFKRERVSITAELTDDATPVDPNPVFFLDKFRAFHNDVLHQKHKGSAISASFATAILSQEETTSDTPELAAQALSARLQQMLELQQAQATWMGGETAARYADAQYAMAVLADETLSTVEWKGKSAWPQVSLERKLYKSSAAELEFFRRIDRLFKEGPATPVSRDLARVYLLTLAAGFRGKYGAFGLTRALHEYRQRLFEYIHGGDALLLYEDDRKLFPEAHAHTIAGRATARLSSLQRWVAVLVTVLAIYVGLAHIAWNGASADLRDVTARVGAAAVTGPR